jgi:hypothetical protein
MNNNINCSKEFIEQIKLTRTAFKIEVLQSGQRKDVINIIKYYNIMTIYTLYNLKSI